jgi:hypothetical protein
MIHIQSSKIGVEEAQHLAKALENNTVRQVFFLINSNSSLQTLTTLWLILNDIGDEETKYLVQALWKNIVRSFFPSLIINSSLCFNTDTHHTRTCRKRYR